jgi:hypothetical protein
MGGLVVDIFVVYVIRALVRKWRQRGTSAWDLKEARIAEICHRPIALGCPVVELVYLYNVDDKNLARMESVQFLWDSSADDYVRNHPRESSLAIRVNPGKPEMSIVVDED